MHGLTGNNPANDPDKKPIKSHSQFKPNYSLYQTLLYGWNQPHFAMEVVADDKVNLRCQSDIDTFNLKAPLMFPVKVYHDYHYVPLRAILPKNADLLVTNPLTGQDVVARDVNAGFDPYYLCMLLYKSGGADSPLAKVTENAGGAWNQTLQWWAAFLGTFFASKQILDPFCSFGSLLNTLGHATEDFMCRSARDNDGSNHPYDDMVERVISVIKTEVSKFTVRFVDVSLSNGTYTYSLGTSIDVDVQSDKVADYTSTRTIGFRQFLRLLSEGKPIYRIQNVGLTTAGGTKARTGLNWSDLSISVSPDTFFYFPIYNPSSVYNAYASDDQRFCNIQRLIAYQLANVQFYTNDSVDYIYTPELYHENQLNLVNQIIGTNNVYSNNYGTYDLNGSTHMYDSVSAHVINAVLNNLGSLTSWMTSPTPGNSFDVFVSSSMYRSMAIPWLYNMFGYQRSLKYRDYFVGAKCRPLAVGDVTVNVNSNMINVVDVTRNIMRQRFFNQVNRLGRTLKEYSRGIFGVTPMADPHEAVLLASTCDIVGASEQDSTDPTANMSQENTTTSKLRNSSSRFAFEISPNEFGILIGITHFEAVRPYTSTTDRQFMHADRFDMFNPYMQNTGDQAVHLSELSQMVSINTKDKSFGYQLRYSEYKQRTDRAVGGFAAGLLPGYAFVLPKADFYELTESLSNTLEINPDFIRARAEDFDQFYSILSHYGLAGYFHFIVRNDLQVDAVRPMEAAPTIL